MPPVGARGQNLIYVVNVVFTECKFSRSPFTLRPYIPCRKGFYFKDS